MRAAVARSGAASLSLVFLLGAATAGTLAQSSPPPALPAAPPPTELTVAVSYPGVIVDPGDGATFPISVTAPTPERVGLAVDGLPEGWEASFHGGEATVSSVTAGLSASPLELRVDVPDEAQPGSVSVTLVASGESRSVELPLDVVVADASAGAVSLTSEFPLLRGDTESPFSFDLELANDTARMVSFTLEAVGPEGWDVSARPSGEEQAATVQVAANDSERVTVTAEPPINAAAGPYPILVRASGDGHSAEAELAVEITGSFALSLETPDGRLNTSGTAGSVIEFPLVVVNDGSAPLQGVALSGTPPREWEVTFEPEAIDLVEPGGAAQAVARITPAANAVAGDYDVTLRASSDQAEDSIAVRTTVETSTLWGLVGLAVIAVVLLGLFLVFRRYGRR
jgi:uncharacterized membrane protein